MQAHIVHLYDQCDRAVDTDGKGHADDRQHPAPDQNGLGGHIRHGDRHDLCGEDEVRTHRARHGARLEGFRVIGRRRSRLRRMEAKQFENFLGALEAKIAPPQHQQRRDRPGRQNA